MIVAVAQIPDRADARAQAAQAAGLALADLNHRLAGTLPRILFPGLPADRATTLLPALQALGFVVFTLEPTAVPSDEDRVVARRVELTNEALVVTDAQGNEHVCPRTSIALLQRGARVATTSEKVTTSERKLDLGRAVMSGGLMLTKKVEKTTVKTTESSEAFLLVERKSGLPDIILYERRLDYRALGSEMQPSSRANLERLWARLKGMVPADTTDDRVARPGFVNGLPATSADPVDLGLYLVALARRALAG